MRLTIPAGHPLYHGTDARFDERTVPLRPGAWLGYPLDESMTYVKKVVNGGERRLIRYVTRREANLVHVLDASRLREELAASVTMGQDGVFIDLRDPENGTHAVFAILADPASLVDHVSTHHLGPRPDIDADDEEWKRSLALEDAAVSVGADDPALPAAGTMSLGSWKQAAPRYLPDGDHVPNNWPLGTGITLVRTTETPDDRVAVAMALAGFGCAPEVALQAADRILEDGTYSTRVRTITAILAGRSRRLRDIGIAVEFEQAIPEGNHDHIRHPLNWNRLLTGVDAPLDREPDWDLIQPYMAKALDAEAQDAMSAFGMR